MGGVIHYVEYHYHQCSIIIHLFHTLHTSSSGPSNSHRTPIVLVTSESYIQCMLMSLRDSTIAEGGRSRAKQLGGSIHGGSWLNFILPSITERYSPHRTSVHTQQTEQQSLANGL